MDRQQFLERPMVAGLVEWLRANLATIPVELRIAASRYVPGGINAQCIGLEEVLTNYRWHSSWNDPRTNREVVAGDWETTRESLKQLRHGLRGAIGQDGGLLESYCKAVLQWGGVYGAIPFLRYKTVDGTLADYLSSMQQLLKINGNQTLDQLNAQSVLRFDSGLTKIHALLDSSGLPI